VNRTSQGDYVASARIVLGWVFGTKPKSHYVNENNRLIFLKVTI